VVLDGIAGAEPRSRELVKGLKSLAVLHRAAVVLVSKAVLPTQRRTAQPALEDLREYEEMADLIDLALMMHRDDIHDCDSTRSGEVDLEIIKHR
jgi:replicative DNA helicase